MNCVSKSHPDVVKLSRELGVSPSVAAAKIGVWQDEHKTDKFPTADQIHDVRSVQEIKKRIGLPSKKELSSTQMSLVMGRLRLYNDKYNTSHQLVPRQVGQSDLRTYTFIPDFTPKNMVWQQQRDAARLDPDRDPRPSPRPSPPTLFSLAAGTKGIDPTIRARLFPTEKVMMSDMLKKIAGSDHVLNKLAEKLLPFTKDTDMPISLQKTLSSQGTPALGLFHTAGYIEINEAGTFGPGGVEATILHEVLHALSVYIMRLPNQTHSVKVLKQMYSYAKEQLKNDPYWSKAHALSTEEEFIVALFTNGAFAKTLETLPPFRIDQRFKNFLQDILDYFLTALKLDTNPTLYKQAFAVATNVLVAQYEYANAMVQTTGEALGFKESNNIGTPKANIPQNLVSGIEMFGTKQEANDKAKKLLGDNPHSIDMIEAGLRTRTTRSVGEMQKYNIKVGDIVKQFGKSADGTTKNILTRVTAIHPKGSPEFFNTWEKEGWTNEGIEAIKRFKDGAAAIEFEVITNFQITPQQKQQAQQLYSQYLATSSKQDIAGFKAFLAKNTGTIGESFAQLESATGEELFQNTELLIELETELSKLEQVIEDDFTAQAFTFKEGPNPSLESALIKRGVSERAVRIMAQFVQENKLWRKPLSEVIGMLRNTLVLTEKGQELYHKKLEAAADKELNKQLVDFLKEHMGVQVIQQLTDHYGSTYAVADILNKVITVYKDNLLTMPKEAGRFFFEFLGKQHPLQRQLLLAVPKWAGYKAIYEKYSKVYQKMENGKLVPDVEKIKREAVGQAIGESIVRQSQKSKDTFFQLLDEAIQIIRKILDSLGRFSFDTAVDDIAQKILNKDSSLLKQVDTSEYKLRTYEETLKNYPQVKKLIDKIRSTGAVLTGSLSLRAQGTLFRPINEDVHDLDFRIPWEQWKGDINSFLGKMKKIFPEITLKTRGDGSLMIWEEGDYTSVLAQIGEHSVDLFFQRDGKNQPAVDGNISWYDTFKAKYEMGRAKDMDDLLKWSNFRQTALNDLSQAAVFQSRGEEVKHPVKTARTVEQVAREFLEAAGVPVWQVDEIYAAGGTAMAVTETVTLNGQLALIVKHLQGAEKHIPEEASHILEILLRGTELHTILMQTVDQYPQYWDVINDQFYVQSYEGDETLLRREAVAKVITAYLNGALQPKTSQQKTLLNRIIDFLKKLFGKSNPLELEQKTEEAFLKAAQIMTEKQMDQLKPLSDLKNLENTRFFAGSRTVEYLTHPQYERFKNNQRKVLVSKDAVPNKTEFLVARKGSPDDTRAMRLIAKKSVQINLGTMDPSARQRTLETLARKLGYSNTIEMQQYLDNPVSGEIPADVASLIKNNGIFYMTTFDKTYEKAVQVTGITEVDGYLVNLQNQIEILERQVSERTVEDEIYEEITGESLYELNMRQKLAELKERKTKLQEAALDKEAAKGSLLDYAIGPVGENGQQADMLGGDLGTVQQELASFELMDAQQRWHWLANARIILANWEEAAAISHDLYKGYQKKRHEMMTAKVQELKVAMDKVAEAFLNELLQKNTTFSTEISNFFAPHQDVSSATMTLLGLGSSGHPLLVALYDLMNKANIAASDTADAMAEEISERTEALLKWGTSRGMTEDQVWAMFDQEITQPDGSVVWTGNDIGKYMASWYEARKAMAAGDRSAYYQWLEDNATKVRKTVMVEENGKMVEKDFYTVRLAEMKQNYMEKVTNPTTGVVEDVFNEKKYNEWVTQNNPDNLQKWETNKWVKLVPKGDQWLDDKYKELLKPENKPALEFFEWWTNFKRERMRVYPYPVSYSQPANYLPSLHKEMAWKQVFQGASAFSFKDAIASLMTTTPEATEVLDPINPRSGKPIHQVPIKMMKSIPVSHKSHDRRAVGMALAASSLMFEKMHALQGPMQEALDLLRETEVPTLTGLKEHVTRQSTGQPLYTKTPENAVKMLESYIEGVMFGRPYDHGGAVAKWGDKEINVATMIDSLLTYSRWLGIGLDMATASAELFQSTMAVFNYSLEGDIINREDAFKGLGLAFQSMEWLPTMAYVPGAPVAKLISKDAEKAAALIKYFHLETDLQEPTANAQGKLVKGINQVMYYNQSRAEAFKNTLLLGAVMNAEEWKFKDKKGNLRPIWDAFVEKGGKISLSDEFDPESFNDKKGVHLKDMLRRGDGKTALEQQLKGLKKLEFGNYEDIPRGYRSVVTRMLMVFRRWLPEAVARRVDIEKPRLELGRDKQGNVRTTKGWYWSMGEYFSTDDSILTGVGRIGSDLGLEILSQLSFRTLGRPQFATLHSQRDKANMMRIAADMKWTLAFGLMMAWLLSGADDEDDPQYKFMIRWWAGQSYRLYSSFNQFLLPSDESRTTQNLIPWSRALSSFNAVTYRFSNIVMYEMAGVKEFGPLEFKPDTYPTGPYAGTSAFWRAFVKGIPGVQVGQDMVDLTRRDPFTGY